MLRSATLFCVIGIILGILDRIKVSLFQMTFRTAPEYKESGAFRDMR